MEKRVANGFCSVVCSVGKTCTCFFERKSVMKKLMLMITVMVLAVAGTSNAATYSVAYWTNGWDHSEPLGTDMTTHYAAWGDTFAQLSGTTYTPSGGQPMLRINGSSGLFAWKFSRQSGDTQEYSVDIDTAGWAGASNAVARLDYGYDGHSSYGNVHDHNQGTSWWGYRAYNLLSAGTGTGNYSIAAEDIIVPSEVTNFYVFLRSGDNWYYGTIPQMNVEFTAVPEPATIGLLAIGAPGFIRRR